MEELFSYIATNGVAVVLLVWLLVIDRPKDRERMDKFADVISNNTAAVNRLADAEILKHTPEE